MIGFRIVAIAGCAALAGALATHSFAQQPAPPAPPKPAAPKPAPKPGPKVAPKPAAPAAGDVEPNLLGQYGDWGAYTASPGGRKICFALAKPKSSKTEPAGRSRDQSYLFISSRPAENVKNEVSVMIGYAFKSSSDATAEIGTTKFTMVTQADGAWFKNSSEDARIVEAMRRGSDLTIKGTSGRGAQSTDQYSLKGLVQALDKIDQECR